MKRTRNSPRNWWRKTTSRGERSTASRVLLRLFSFALIALLVLSVVSCRSAKTLTKTESSQSREEARADSTVERTETTLTWTDLIPPDTARLRLDLDALLRLPEGAAFEQHNGRAKVKVGVSRKDGKPRIEVEASADSVPRTLHKRTTSTERKSTSSATSANERKKSDVKERPPNALQSWVWQTMAVLVLGLVITMIIKKRIWQKVF